MTDVSDQNAICAGRNVQKREASVSGGRRAMSCVTRDGDYCKGYRAACQGIDNVPLNSSSQRSLSDSRDDEAQCTSGAQGEDKCAHGSVAERVGPRWLVAR